MRPALSAAALLSTTLILISSCSSGQPGIAAPVSTVSHTSVAPTPLTSATSAVGSPSSSPSETLILGTNRLGTHQFNLETGYNAKQIAQGVEIILTKPESTGYGYPPSAVDNIKCPTSQAVIAGTSFECTVEINGESKTVTVDIVGSFGTYIVQAPQ